MIWDPVSCAQWYMCVKCLLQVGTNLGGLSCLELTEEGEGREIVFICLFICWICFLPVCLFILYARLSVSVVLASLAQEVAKLGGCGALW